MTHPGEFVTEGAPDASSTVHLRVLATSDLHAHLLPFDYFTDKVSKGMGLARLGTLVAAARAAARNCILVDNGDTLQGAPLADAAVEVIVPEGRAHPMIATMNAMGFDAATLGNHDFDFGLEHLRASVDGAEFPFVLANGWCTDGTPLMPTRQILEREVRDNTGKMHTLRIGITGAVPPQVAEWNRQLVDGQAEFEPILPAIAREVEALREEGADIVLILAHSGPGTQQTDARAENVARLIAAMPGVDAVVAGHTHSVTPDGPPGPVNGVPLVQPGAYGTHLGCIDLALLPPVTHKGSNAGWQVANARAGNFATNALFPQCTSKFQRILPDFPEVRSLIAREHRVTRAYAARPLGATSEPLETYFSTLAPCRATQLISEAQLAAARPLLDARPDLQDLPLLSAVAPFKAGGRAGPHSYTDVPVGPMKLRHAADLYIYPNQLSVLRISGAGLREWLERSASLYNRINPGSSAPQELIDRDFAPYNFDAITGLRYEIDVTQPGRTNAEGDREFETPGRILNLRFMDGRPVEPDDTALVVTNSYRAAGGGHMRAAAEAELVIQAQFSVRDAVARFVSGAEGPIAPIAAPTWGLKPLGGVPVIYETGPGALAHSDRAAQLGLSPRGEIGGDCFASYEMML